jgi:molybdopterin-binding protein
VKDFVDCKSIVEIDCVSKSFSSVVTLENVEETKLSVGGENDDGSVALITFNIELLVLIEVLMEVDDCS